MLPVKAYTYSLNVMDSNPKWELSHELTDYYEMKDLSPANFDDLSKRILKDE